MTGNSERTTCPYCGDEFDSEQERGVHIAEDHTETDDKITKKTKNRNNHPDPQWMRRRKATG